MTSWSMSDTSSSAGAGDNADVLPLRGIIYTDSQHSAINVAVDVAQCEGNVLYVWFTIS